jgi:hypothetical protein
MVPECSENVTSSTALKRPYRFVSDLTLTTGSATAVSIFAVATLDTFIRSPCASERSGNAVPYPWSRPPSVPVRCKTTSSSRMATARTMPRTFAHRGVLEDAS